MFELIKKLPLIFKSAKPVGEFINQMKGAKLKYKTLPFWISILTSGSAVVAALQGFIPATTAVVITTGLTAAYNILRGLDKTNQVGVKPPIQTTEFWLGVAAILSNSIVEVQTAGVNNQVLMTAQVVLGAAMTAAQGLAANQPKKES